MLRLLAALLASALLLNLHYALLGRPFLEGPLTSRPVLALINLMTSRLVRLGLTKQGVPMPDRTETYSFGGGRGRIDVFEPDTEDGDALRPAVLYFHSGAFIAGSRTFGAGVCGWLASHGAVCLSASYRLTNSGAGVAGCIDDAWAAYRWVRANAQTLRVDPTKITVVGDSAGGLLATALGTGLGGALPTGVGGEAPPGRSALPAAVVGGWPVVTLGVKSYYPQRAADGIWEDTPAGTDFDVANAFVPAAHRHSAQATHARLRTVLAGSLLLYGRRRWGLLPAATQPFPADDGASVSPLWRVGYRSDLPPMLLLTAADDQVVPCAQTSRFAERARAAGNECAQLIFEGAVHGGGGVNCAAGRHAVLAFLRHHALLPQCGGADEQAERPDDPRDCMGGTMRTFSLKPVEYAAAGAERFRPSLHARATLRLKPR